MWATEQQFSLFHNMYFIMFIQMYADVRCLATK